MASFVPPLMDPANPDAIANWAREVADLLNGQISIGEPIATLADGTGGVDTLRPNGVKGHVLGSFVQATWTAAAQRQLLTHNLNIEPKGLTGVPYPAAPTGHLYTDPLNVAWIIVRCRSAAGVGGGGGGAVLDWHGGLACTANFIELECHISAHLPSPVNPFITDIWFFPTTR